MSVLIIINGLSGILIIVRRFCGFFSSSVIFLFLFLFLLLIF